MPVGPTSVNSFSRWSSDIVESKPGKPLKWSPCRCEMKTPVSFCGEMPARAIWVCVPSPQSNSHHSPSPTTASALTLRRSVGLPELVPSGIIFISLSLRGPTVLPPRADPRHFPFSIFNCPFHIRRRLRPQDRPLTDVRIENRELIIRHHSAPLTTPAHVCPDRSSG